MAGATAQLFPRGVSVYSYWRALFFTPRFQNASQAVSVLLSLAEIASASTIYLSALPEAGFRGRGYEAGGYSSAVVSILCAQSEAV